MVYSDIISMTATPPIDILGGFSRVIFYSDEDQSVLDLSHDSLNALRSLLMSSVDYPNNFFRRDYTYGTVSVPVSYYEYHHDAANMHVYQLAPGNQITFTFNSNKLVLLITGLHFDVSQYILGDGEYIQPWYNKFHGKTNVQCTMTQTPEFRMIDSFCDRLYEILPYDKSSPLNTKVFDIIKPL